MWLVTPSALLLCCLLAQCALFSRATAQDRSTRTMSVAVSATRTVTTTSNLSKTEECGTRSKTSDSKVTVQYHFNSSKAIVDDNGTEVQLTVYGSTSTNGSQPLLGSGSVACQGTSYESYSTHCESDCSSNSKSTSSGSAQVDPAEFSLSFSYDRQKKQGDYSISSKFLEANANGSFESTTCKEHKSGVTNELAKVGVEMAGVTYGQFAQSSWDMIQEAYGNSPDIVAQMRKGLNAAGNGGVCSIVETNRGFEISYSNSATIDNAEGETDGYTGSATTTITTTVHISIGGEPVHYDAILVPGNRADDSHSEYDTWIPEGTEDGSADRAGNRLTFHIKLVKKDEPKKEVTDVDYTVTYRLKSSHEPGVAINYPLASPDGKADLRFDPFLKKYSTVASVSDSELVSVDKRGRDVEAVVVSYDYGSFGTISAKVVIPPGTELEAHFDNDKTEIAIPRDDNDNHIADKWEKDSSIFGKNYSASWDDEKQSGNSNNGDGLTLYEEYRGLFTKGKHHRLSPNAKEAGIASDGSVSLDVGYTYFRKASGIAPIELKPGKEISESALIVNPNSRSGKGGDQHAVLIKFMPITADNGIEVLGRTVPKSPTAGASTDIIGARRAAFSPEVANSPGDVEYLAINTDKLKDPVEAADLPWTFAHELAHAMHVNHHGNTKPFRVDSWLTNFILDSATVYISEKGDILDKPSLVAQIKAQPQDAAIAGSQASGDVDCIMCYNSVFELSIPFGVAGHKIVFPKLGANGTTFCTSKLGTGRNSPQFRAPNGVKVGTVFGDAEIGNCMSQFQVKDWK